MGLNQGHSIVLSSYHYLMARVNELLGDIATILNDLPDVFSTPQWGGRAYKLPGPDGSLRKPKLLAFVSLTKERDAVSVVFKLPLELSAQSIERFDWIGPFEFGTWKKAGWIAARLKDRRRLRTLNRLLKVSRSLYPMRETPPSPRKRSASSSTSNPVLRRIDRVMAEAKDEGWTPPEN